MEMPGGRFLGRKGWHRSGHRWDSKRASHSPCMNQQLLVPTPLGLIKDRPKGPKSGRGLNHFHPLTSLACTCWNPPEPGPCPKPQ